MGAESGSRTPIAAATLPDSNSNASDRCFQQRDGDCKTDNIQPRDFADAHGAALYRGSLSVVGISMVITEQSLTQTPKITFGGKAAKFTEV
jgi:hypothetical protein